MSDGRDIITLVAQRQDCEHFRRKNWVGTFAEYLDIVREHPEVTRTAYQRIYDMILYVEQPFPYDLEQNRIDVHSVSALSADT